MCKLRSETTYWESFPYCFISHALLISWHQCLTHPGPKKTIIVVHGQKVVHLPQIETDSNLKLSTRIMLSKIKRGIKTILRVNVEFSSSANIFSLYVSHSYPIKISKFKTRVTHHYECQDMHKPAPRMPEEEEQQQLHGKGPTVA